MSDEHKSEAADEEPLETPTSLPSDGSDAAEAAPTRRRPHRTGCERRRVWSRRLESLFWALKVGSLLTAVVAAGLYLTWRTDLPMWWVFLNLGLKSLFPAVVLWGLGILAWQEPAEYWIDWRQRMRTCRSIIMRFIPVAGVAACGLVSSSWAMGLWHLTLTTLDTSAGELLAFAVAAQGLGAFFTFDLLLRVARSFFPYLTSASPRPLTVRGRTIGLARLLPARLLGARSWRSRLALIVVIVAPSLILSGGAYLAYTWDRPGAAPIAAPAALPAYPSSFPSQATWAQDINSVLDVTAGAAGPLVLTDDSIFSLDPATGTVRWDYRRQGKAFAQYGSRFDGVRGELPYLVTSPDRRHVALTLGELRPTYEEDKSDDQVGLAPALTIVLDTVTGRVTNEHFHDGRAVQLTDSVLLAGSAVYSLTDDAVLWRLSDVDIDLSTDYSPYTGTAGHASLVLGTDQRSGSLNGTDRLTLVPETNPRGVVRAVPVASANGRPLVVGGWTVAYTDVDESGSSDVEWDYAKAHRAQAISLDALAKVPDADTRTYDLGQTLGLAPVTSRLSGRLAVLPDTAPDPGTSSDHPVPDQWTDRSTVATTFNPRTRAVLPAAQDPGLVTAVGVTRADDGQGRISLQSGDKTAVTSVPLATGTVSFMAGTIDHNPGLLDFAVNGDWRHEGISALSAPGVTVILLRPTEERQTTGTRLRLYGLVGATS